MMPGEGERIKRWQVGESGFDARRDYVTYADHLRALEAAESENLALRTSVGHLDSRIGELESALTEALNAIDKHVEHPYTSATRPCSRPHPLADRREQVMGESR